MDRLKLLSPFKSRAPKPPAPNKFGTSSSGRQVSSSGPSSRAPPPPLVVETPAAQKYIPSLRSRRDVWLSLFLRSGQFFIALISYCVMAANNQTFTFSSGFTSYNPTIHFNDYVPFSFLVGTMVVTACWTLVLVALDAVELTIGQALAFRWKTGIWLSFDAVLLLLSFGSGCATLGVTSIKGLVCDSQYSTSLSFCVHARIAGALALIEWAALVPSLTLLILTILRENF